MNRSRRIPTGTTGHPRLGKAVGAWNAAAVRLTALDPVTTELVRLRCARHHDCHT